MELIFPVEKTSDGFSTAKTAGHEKGRAEPVIRELLQNCLDARDKTSDRVDVIFTIDELPLSRIPRLEDYRRVYLEASGQQREHGGLSAPDRNVCARIEQVLDSDATGVLFCRDNGIGLNKETMNRLLSEGNTSKTEGGAGSVGVGHLTAFAASDLRYIVYGGKTAEGFRGSGRALLAAWLDKEIKGTRSSEGTLAEKETRQRTLFDSGFFYLESPPSLLKKEMRKVSTTGTVVAVLGFDRFGHEDKEETALEMLKISAAHFLPAVLKGRMTVEVRTGRTLQKLDSGSVGGILDPQGRLRARDVRLPEGIAYRSWRTIKEGVRVENGLGADIRFRPLGEKEKGTRVHFYRDGMWITWKAPWVTGFGAYQPFDAAVMVDRGNELYDLIRDSEGATHYEINQHNLAKAKDKKRLRELLKQITDLLKEQAEEISHDTFTPEGFAVFGAGEKRAEITRPPSRSPKPVEDQDEGGRRQSLSDGNEKETDNGNGDNNNDEDEKPVIKPARPKPGRPAQIRKSVRIEQEDGLIKALTVSVDSNQHPAVGVRVIRETGSDETCDIQLGSKYYSIKPADELTEQSDPYEVRWENGTGIFRVVLDPPHPAESGVPAVDLVVRK